MASKKYIMPMVLFAAALAASAAPPAAGLIEVRPDGMRTLFTTERLHRNDHVVAQSAESQGTAKCCVALRILGPQRRRSDVSDELTGRRVRAYALPSLKAPDTVPYLGGALVFHARDEDSSRVEHALSGDPAGKALPTVCISSEGAHLLQWLDGKPNAHLYMHFDYAVEPSCSEDTLKKFH